MRQSGQEYVSVGKLRRKNEVQVRNNMLTEKATSIAMNLKTVLRIFSIAFGDLLMRKNVISIVEPLSAWKRKEHEQRMVQCHGESIPSCIFSTSVTTNYKCANSSTYLCLI